MSAHPTPTGVLLTAEPPESPAWFAARRGGITGTDLPKILGDSKYGNALSVYHDKRGDLPPDAAGEAALWGQRLEDVVAREWAQRSGVRLRRVGVLAHRDRPWMRASLDRLLVGKREGLEVKTRSAYLAHAYTDTLPDDVLAQVHWGLAVTGLDRMHVAVLIGGQQLRSFTVERDTTIEAFLITAAGAAWRAVQDGAPPDVEADEGGVLLALLDRLYDRRVGDVELPPDLDERTADLIADYRHHSAAEKEIKGAKTMAKTALVQLLAGGQRLLVDGHPVLTYRAPDPAPAIPAEQARRLAADRPALFAALTARGYATTTSPSPRFTLTKEIP